MNHINKQDLHVNTQINGNYVTKMSHVQNSLTMQFVTGNLWELTDSNLDESLKIQTGEASGQSMTGYFRYWYFRFQHTTHKRTNAHKHIPRDGEKTTQK